MFRNYENSRLGNWILARNFLKILFWPLFLRVDCSQSQDASIKPLCRVCSQKLKFLWPIVTFFGFSEYHEYHRHNNNRSTLDEIPLKFRNLMKFPCSWILEKRLPTFIAHCHHWDIAEACPHVHFKNFGFLREGPFPHGAPSVPPFCSSFSWKTARTKGP